MIKLYVCYSVLDTRCVTMLRWLRNGYFMLLGALFPLAYYDHWTAFWWVLGVAVYLFLVFMGWALFVVSGD